MTNTGGRSFGDPNVDLAVSASARAYGEDLAEVMDVDRPRPARCLSAAISALEANGFLTLDEAAELVGGSAQAVRVSRVRNGPAFRVAERRALEALAGEGGEGPFGEAVRIETLRNAVATRNRRQAAREREDRVPARISRRVARKARFVKWFAAAEWPATEIAHLFGLNAKTVRVVAGG